MSTTNALKNYPEKMILVFIQDKNNGKMWIKEITQSFLNELYLKNKVIGKIKETFVVEI